MLKKMRLRAELSSSYYLNTLTEEEFQTSRLLSISGILLITSVILLLSDMIFPISLVILEGVSKVYTTTVVHDEFVYTLYPASSFRASLCAVLLGFCIVLDISNRKTNVNLTNSIFVSRGLLLILPIYWVGVLGFCTFVITEEQGFTGEAIQLIINNSILQSITFFTLSLIAYIIVLARGLVICIDKIDESRREIIYKDVETIKEVLSILKEEVEEDE